MAVAAGRGRKPKPTARKIAAGTRKDRVNPMEPRYDSIQNIDPPEWLQGPGRALWELLAPQLCKQRVLKMTDVQNLEAYCAAYGRFREGEDAIKQYGAIVKDDGGRLFKNPATTVINEAVRQMATLGSMLGLDPASRQRLTGPEPADGGNPFAALIGGR